MPSYQSFQRRLDKWYSNVIQMSNLIYLRVIFPLAHASSLLKLRWIELAFQNVPYNEEFVFFFLALKKTYERDLST